MDKNVTATVNGFFICVVFLHHFCVYCKPSMRSLMGDLFGQLFVTTFFFYSGYGCATQFLTRGSEYIQSFPRKRLLPTILRFDFAVCVFLVVTFLLGKTHTIRKTALAFLGWDSIGNSNWYIFTIVLCYLAFYLSSAISCKSETRERLPSGIHWWVVFAIVLGYVIVLSRVKPPWWSDTLMAFPAGVVVGLHGNLLLGFLKKHYWGCLLGLIAAIVSIPHCPFIGHRHWISFNVKSVAFPLVVVMATMRIRLDSPVLLWCGRHLFALYIYQRLPMVVFTTLYPSAFQTWFRWIYFVLSLVIAVAIAFLYEKSENALLNLGANR